MHVCTIVAHNYLAQARVLGRSLKAADPDATLWVLVVDGVHEGDEEPFELVAPQELDLGDDLAVMRLIYDVTELSTAVKPALLRMLLRRTGGPVTYLDPDIEVFASLGEVVRLAGTHGLVLTPHLLEPLPADERQPSDVDILLSGAYNLGFVSVADRPDVHALLDWWDRSLRRDCIIDHSHGRFVDQRFMDLALGFVDDHFVLRDPGYNVAYWNLSQRELHRNGDGVTVSGHPLRFFHYSGFDPRRPLRISKHQSRLTFDDVPVVAELYASYAAALRAEGFTEQARLPYAYDRTPAGLVLDLPLRRLLRSAFVDGELPDTLDAFSPDGDAQLTAWLNEPASDGPLAGIPRVLAWVAGQRDDLTRLFGHGPRGAGAVGPRVRRARGAGPDPCPRWMGGRGTGAGPPGEPEPGSTGVDTPPAPRAARPPGARAPSPPGASTSPGSCGPSSASARPPARRSLRSTRRGSPRCQSRAASSRARARPPTCRSARPPTRRTRSTSSASAPTCSSSGSPASSPRSSTADARSASGGGRSRGSPTSSTRRSISSTRSGAGRASSGTRSPRSRPSP